MVESVEVVIKPVCVRFSLFEGDVFYHFASCPDAQLDKMERLMGVEPGLCADFKEANLGFLPVCRTGLGISRLVRAVPMRKVILKLLREEPRLMTRPPADNTFIWEP